MVAGTGTSSLLGFDGASGAEFLVGICLHVLTRICFSNRQGGGGKKMNAVFLDHTNKSILRSEPPSQWLPVRVHLAPLHESCCEFRYGLGAV